MVAAEVYAGINALKTAMDIAKGLQNIHDGVARDKAVFDLQREMLAAQAQQMSLIETVGELKKRLAEFETWEQEKLRYELKNIGYAFAYQLKPTERENVPPHWVCADCFGQRHISIIQYSREGGRGMLWRCPSCKNAFDPGTFTATWVD